MIIGKWLKKRCLFSCSPVQIAQSAWLEVETSIWGFTVTSKQQLTTTRVPSGYYKTLYICALHTICAVFNSMQVFCERAILSWTMNCFSTWVAGVSLHGKCDEDFSSSVCYLEMVSWLAVMIAVGIWTNPSISHCCSFHRWLAPSRWSRLTARVVEVPIILFFHTFYATVLHVTLAVGYFFPFLYLWLCSHSVLSLTFCLSDGCPEYSF